MTCMPCSYRSAVGFSLALAKWPLTVMTEGAVGCLLFVWGRDGGDDKVEAMITGSDGGRRDTPSNGTFGEAGRVRVTRSV